MVDDQEGTYRQVGYNYHNRFFTHGSVFGILGFLASKGQEQVLLLYLKTIKPMTGDIGQSTLSIESINRNRFYR